MSECDVCLFVCVSVYGGGDQRNNSYLKSTDMQYLITNCHINATSLTFVEYRTWLMMVAL